MIRALESNYIENNDIVEGHYITNLRIGRDFVPQVIHGIISGMHVPSESHMDIMRAFTHNDLLDEGYTVAVNSGFLWHEYGDVTLVI